VRKRGQKGGCKNKIEGGTNRTSGLERKLTGPKEDRPEVTRSASFRPRERRERRATDALSKMRETEATSSLKGMRMKEKQHINTPTHQREDQARRSEGGRWRGFTQFLGGVLNTQSVQDVSQTKGKDLILPDRSKRHVRG